MVEHRELRVANTDKTFFTKLTNTISKLLIPTKVGINGMLISIKRNNLLKNYEMYSELKREDMANKKETLTTEDRFL